MKHSDFYVGCEFRTEDGRWRCTDTGHRTIVAIKIDPVEVTRIENSNKAVQRLSRDEAEWQGWFNGPPYALVEVVFDESDMEGCKLA